MMDETTPTSEPLDPPAAPVQSTPPAQPTEPTVRAAEPSGPAAVVAAGSPPPAEGTSPPTGGTPAPTPSEPPARALKVVLTLAPHRPDGNHDQPRNEASAGVAAGPLYDAMLAVGADGCDPQFRSLAGTALAGALDEVPALIADAETRWQSRPRYPRPAPPPKASKTQPAASGARPKTQQRAAKSEPSSGRRTVPPAAGSRTPGGAPTETDGSSTTSTTPGRAAKEAIDAATAQPRQISLFG